MGWGRLPKCVQNLLPPPRVYFPKSVIINNPWLSLMYWSMLAAFIVLAGFMFFGMRRYAKIDAVTGEVSVLPWRLERRLADVEESVRRDRNSSFCSDPDHYTYESSTIAYDNITCAGLCRKTNRGTACMHPREVGMLEGPAAVFVPTFYTNEVLNPATGSEERGHYFVPGAEDLDIAFRHRLTVPAKTYAAASIILWLLSPFTSDLHSVLSTQDTGDPMTRMMTVVLDKDGTVKKKFEPGAVVSLTVGEMLQSAIVDEFVDTVSKLSLDDHYVRVEENILADREFGRDRGPTARLTGTRITVNLEYTDTGRCALDPTSPPMWDFPDFDGYLACMSIKAARSWTTLDRTSVVGEDGTQTNRRYHGVRVAFHTHGRFAFTDLVSIWEWMTIFLIWSQIPTVVVYFFVINFLGKLSEVYRHVVHQSMRMDETIKGLGARLITHSSSFLDLSEDTVLSRKKLLDRFLGIFRHSEDLDDEEVRKFVDFVYSGMVKDNPQAQSADMESSNQLAVPLEAYCKACNTNEPIGFDQLVDVFDADRWLRPLEFIFNDPLIAQFRREGQARKGPQSEVLMRLNADSGEDGNSNFEKIRRKAEDTASRVEAATDDLTGVLDDWLRELRAVDKDALFERKRRELAAKGRPEKRPIMRCDNGGLYEGQWVQNFRHGVGTEYRNGSTYQGEWAANVQHGIGVLTTPTGASYEGEWLNGKRHGEGFEKSPDGRKYEGQYARGSKSGHGTLVMIDGATYKGEMLEGKMHGKGMYQGGGHVYDGYWQYGQAHGEGTYTEPNGKRYSGQFSYNQKDGHGVFNWPDGRSYDGQYLQDVCHGKGTLRTPDGTLIRGEWIKGRQHGAGTITNSKGKERTAQWRDGKRLHVRHSARVSSAQQRRTLQSAVVQDDGDQRRTLQSSVEQDDSRSSDLRISNLSSASG